MLNISLLLRSLTVLPIAAILISTSTLHATATQSKPFEIPFDFKVGSRQLPSGEYRVEPNASPGMVNLVNTRTGEKVQVLRSAANHEEGKTRLVFENNQSGHLLKRVS